MTADDVLEGPRLRRRCSRRWSRRWRHRRRGVGRLALRQLATGGLLHLTPRLSVGIVHGDRPALCRALLQAYMIDKGRQEVATPLAEWDAASRAAVGRVVDHA